MTERYFYGVFVDVTDEKLAQKAGELYEKELAYFVPGGLQPREVSRAGSILRRTGSRVIIPQKPPLSRRRGNL